MSGSPPLPSLINLHFSFTFFLFCVYNFTDYSVPSDNSFLDSLDRITQLNYLPTDGECILPLLKIGHSICL